MCARAIQLAEEFDIKCILEKLMGFKKFGLHMVGLAFQPANAGYTISRVIQDLMCVNEFMQKIAAAQRR